MDVCNTTTKQLSNLCFNFIYHIYKFTTKVFDFKNSFFLFLNLLQQKDLSPWTIQDCIYPLDYPGLYLSPWTIQDYIYPPGLSRTVFIPLEYLGLYLSPWSI